MARYYENNDRDFHHCDNCDKYFRSPEASLWWCSAYDGSGVAGDDEGGRLCLPCCDKFEKNDNNKKEDKMIIKKSDKIKIELEKVMKKYNQTTIDYIKRSMIDTIYSYFLFTTDDNEKRSHGLVSLINLCVTLNEKSEYTSIINDLCYQLKDAYRNADESKFTESLISSLEVYLNNEKLGVFNKYDTLKVLSHLELKEVNQ